MNPNQTSNTNPLSDFDFEFNGTLCPDEVRQLASATFINKGENLLLVGDGGTGKTMLARAAVASARDNGNSVVWLAVPTTTAPASSARAIAGRAIEKSCCSATCCLSTKQNAG
jgi:DNA replication protein DnaC